MRRSLGPTYVHVQVKNRYARGDLVRTSFRIVTGNERLLAWAQSFSEDSKRPNTSYAERLNLFARRNCSYLNRRTPSPMRQPDCLSDSIEILRCHYNYVRPHSSLKFGRVMRTPAMQAGIFDRPLTFRDIFSRVFPPRSRLDVLDFRNVNPRGRRAS